MISFFCMQPGYSISFYFTFFFFVDRLWLDEMLGIWDSTHNTPLWESVSETQT